MNYLLNEAVQKEELQTLENILNEFLTYSDEKIQRELLPCIRKILRKYRTEFKKKYHLPKEVCIYNKPLYWVFEQIVQISKNEKNGDSLKPVLEYCKYIINHLEFKDSKNSDFLLDDEVELLKIADDKYQIFNLAKRTKKEIIMFDLTFVCNDEFTFASKEFKNVTYLEALIINSQRTNGKMLNFVRMVALIYNGLIMDDPFEIPFGFHRIIKIYRDHDVQMTKDEGLLNFIEFFGFALLYNTKYNIILTKPMRNLGSEMEKVFKNIINYCYPDECGEWVEIPDDMSCPCESNKSYKNCCKKKRLQWGIQDGEIVKKLPLEKPVIKALKEIEEKMLDILQRKPKPNEKVFRLIVNPNFHINNMIKKLRKIGLDEERLYASYKIELILTEMNVQMLPDFEEKNWKKALKEYQKITEKEGNILSQVRMIDDYLKELWPTYLKQANAILTSLLSEMKEDYFKVKKFRIQNLFDFAAFCSERVRQNNEALCDALEKEHYEVAMAINRMMYEDLVNINVYFQNENLFEKHIMTLSKIEQGIYKKLEKDGKISTKIAVNPKTEEKINYSITLKELSKYANENYKELYEELFRELSSYTHMNITTTDHYFEKADPFYDVDPVNIAGILGLFLVNQIIFEFSRLETCEFVHRDIVYFTDKIKELLIPAFIELKELYPTQSSLYYILLKCVVDYEYVK